MRTGLGDELLAQLPLPLEPATDPPSPPSDREITSADGYVYRGSRPADRNSGEAIHEFVWVCEYDYEGEPLLAEAEVIARDRESAETLLSTDEVADQLYYAIREYELQPMLYVPGEPIVTLRLRDPWW